MGRSTWSSSPVDMRGTKFVPGTVFMSAGNFTLVPPSHWKATSEGQPYNVLFSCVRELGATWSCDWRRTPTVPTSANGARVIGPSTWMRYSMLAKAEVSPPGSVMLLTAMGTITLPRLGLVGSTGTWVPSGLVRKKQFGGFVCWQLGGTMGTGTKTYGETVRTSKPRKSPSPPI